ncbi:MAG: enoyl-CoA hydratase-related protein [Aggregatilineales bacterium]|nr:enoyl-CoA hydratase-related protein [Aggregatilineales bacterium]HPV08651.1 enoyl-CoA hydratase-related protein [Aggregatilineales bacterium]HQE17468.1 enoyl-CoA hydratase-related protein [Aggregatilineales bacterium]
MEYRTILTGVHDRVGLIRLNRPEALNALNGELMRELVAALRAFDDDPDIGAMVITGSDRAFAAGADIKEMASRTAVEMLHSDMIGTWDAVASMKKPVIAAVSGYALGGGAELALMCDMIVASETAVFGQPEINLGVIPGAGGTQRLARTVGKALAMEMVLNDRRLSAEEALQRGLVNYVYPVETYLDEALRLANEIAARAPVAVRLAKEAVNKAFELPLAEGLAFERRNFYFLFATSDQKEGMDAFIGKRKPEWKGE